MSEKINFEELKKYKIEAGFLIDDKKNKVNIKFYSLYEAIKMLRSLINCESCTDCYNCKDSIYCKNCKDCISCKYCYDCFGCKDSQYCKSCFNLEGCKLCDNFMNV